MRFTRALPVLLFLIPFFPQAAAAPPNDFFVVENAFPGYVWNDLHGTSSTNIFAVGGNGVASAIARRTGGGWAIQTVPNIGVLRSVWVQSTTLAYATSDAVAATGSFLKWDGATWASIVGSCNYNKVWGTDATHILFLCDSGNGLYKYDGTTQTALGSCGTASTAPLGTIFARPAGAVYSMGNNRVGGVSNLLDFATYAAVTSCNMVGGAGPTAVRDSWRGVDAVQNMIYVGNLGAAYIHNNGFAVTNIPTGTTNQLNAIWGTGTTAGLADANGVWVVGNTGTVLYGMTVSGVYQFVIQPTTTADNLNGVYFSDASNGWTVSNAGNIYKLQVVTPVGPPVVGLALVHNEDLLDLTTQNANCIGDSVPFTVDLDLSGPLMLNDGDIWIYSRQAGFWVQDIDDSTWNPVINALPLVQFAGVSTVLPPGDYYALLIADIGGIGAVDLFDSKAFTVSKSPCTDSGAQDLTTITDRLIRIERQVNNNSVNIGAVSVNLNETHVDVDAIERQANNISLNLGGARTDINTTKADVAEMHQDVDAMEANLIAERLRTNSTFFNVIATSLRVNSTYANLVAARVDINETEQHTDDILAHQPYQDALVNYSRIFIAANAARAEATLNETEQHTDDILDRQSYGFAQANATHSHIDAHFNNTWSRQSYTNALINATAAGLNFTLGDLIIRIDHNITQMNITITEMEGDVDNIESIVSNLNASFSNRTVQVFTTALGIGLGNTSTLNILIILLMVVIGTWLWLKKEFIFKFVGPLIIFVAGVIAIQIAQDWKGGWQFAFIIILYSVGLLIYSGLDKKKLRREKREKMEL